MIYLLANIILLFTIGYFLYRSIEPTLNVVLYWSVLIIKLSAGVAVGLLYFNYYGNGDTIVYHEAASVLANTAKSSSAMFFDIYLYTGLPSFQNQPRAWFMVQLLTPIHLITNNNYWISSCWFSLFSFSGLYFLWSRIRKIWPDQSFAAFIGLMLFPSVVFWSSGIIKESIGLGTIAFSMGYIIQYFYLKRRFIYILLFFLLLLLLWYIKYYLAAVFVISFLPFILSQLFTSGKTWTVIVGLAVLLVLVSLSHPNFYPQRIVEVIHYNYEIYQSLSEQGSAISYPYEENHIFFVILNAPLAVVGTLVFPIWPHDFSLPVIAAVCENLLIICILIGFLWNIIKNGLHFSKFHWSVMIYILLLALFLGLSVPNYGTLSRFRVSFLPFFVWIILADNYFLVNFKYRFKNKTWIKNQ